MKLRISRAKIILGLMFIALVVLVDFARRDMNLDVDVLRQSLMNMPGMVMENIQMTREISGDLWSVKVPFLQQEGSTLSMRSIDITRTMSGDRGEWYFFGRDAVFSSDIMEVSINRLLGTIEGTSRTWNLESRRLDWKDQENALVFPEGLTIYDSELMLQAPQASIDRSGVILLQRGGVIKWIKPSGY